MLQWAFLQYVAKVESERIIKVLLVSMFIETHKRETGIPSNRRSRYGECVNNQVHTARTLLEWVGSEDKSYSD